MTSKPSLAQYNYKLAQFARLKKMNLTLPHGSIQISAASKAMYI